ncbi:hypothetical protein N7456_012292 [Penicillium angulare]|uniref:AB hydrolase-1 domain-containing protein n=1 Tax=Penicillium angulare TaxID=116970 RepID=A0A9W9EVL2_9EURO|nr:hypothetical protein N7456_012292 [Penicillium angulare]
MVSKIISESAEEPYPTKRFMVTGQKIATVPHHDLEFGGSLKKVPVAYTTHGSLSQQGDNVIVICHALSGSAKVGEWWQALLNFGCNAALDTSKYFIVCMNCLGSPYGTASPVTYKDGDPALGPYGADFPLTSIRDDVRLFRKVLDGLGVKQILSVIGGSMGGMHVLEFSYFGPDYVKSIIPIATSASYSAWGIAWGENQRQCIYMDPRYRECKDCPKNMMTSESWLMGIFMSENGDYSQEDPPVAGLGAARMAAMLSYRSHKSFQARFGRRAQKASLEATDKNKNPNDCKENSPLSLMAVQSYLQYQAKKFVNRFDANCYIALTHKLDTHDVSRGRSSTVLESLQQIKQPTLVMTIRSDILFVFEEQLDLYRGIPNCRKEEIISADGHDGFLLEAEQINRFIGEFLEEVRMN